jgi:cholesterol oxidase
VRELSEQVAKQLGADFMDNPLWHLNRVVTVHPLGGCPMGRNQEEGVVDANGEVFGHPGLHVADGSIMPGPVGPNPSLTIAAAADRAADAILAGRTADLVRAPRPRGPAPPAAPPAAPAAADGDAVAVSFTEEMKGFVAFGAEDFERGHDEGERDDNSFMFHLTITAANLDRFISDRDHLGRAAGYVHCEALGGRCPVQRGDFNLFIDSNGDERDKRMLYRLHFSDGEEHPLTMTGFKVVKDDPGVDNVWADTSTLYTRLLAGHVEAAADGAAEVLAAGILHIEPLDFAKQMTTFDTEPDGRADAVARFGALFAGNLWEVYGPSAETDG